MYRWNIAPVRFSMFWNTHSHRLQCTGQHRPKFEDHSQFWENPNHKDFFSEHFINPLWEICVALPGYAKAEWLQEQHHPFLSLVSVHAVFSCVQTMVWLACLGFWMCMQMRSIAQRGGYVNTIREPALRVNFGEKKNIPWFIAAN